MIPDKHIQEFKSIYKEQFGEEISDAYALEIATKFVDLMEVIYKPMSKEKFDELAKRNLSKPLEPAQ